jgi:hypothetical protein
LFRTGTSWLAISDPATDRFPAPALVRPSLRADTGRSEPASAGQARYRVSRKGTATKGGHGVGKDSQDIQQNVVGYVALFLVLSGGTAYALDGSNTVFSDDITNDQVRSVDVPR